MEVHAHTHAARKKCLPTDRDALSLEVFNVVLWLLL